MVNKFVEQEKKRKEMLKAAIAWAEALQKEQEDVK